MRFSKHKLLNKNILSHIGLWVSVILFLSFIYGVGAPGTFTSFFIILMFIPVHVTYFYTAAYWLIPKYIDENSHLKLAASLLTLAIVCTLAFRTIEIFWADPYFNRVMLEQNPEFQWKKLRGTIKEQYLNPIFLVTAFEQTNFIIWICLAIRFFRMWHFKKQSALQAELNFLKAQVHPHFLFNTLNNLYALSLENSPKSPTAILGLSNILRYMLYECNTDKVYLKRDLEILENYINLEKLRYEDQLDLTVSINGWIKEQTIAPLLMLPLVENAFKHGASEMIKDAWINIQVEINGNNLKLKVSNGFPVELLEHTEDEREKIGLINVHRRLRLLYPNAYTFNTYADDDIFVAILELDLSKNQEKIASSSIEDSRIEPKQDTPMQALNTP